MALETLVQDNLKGIADLHPVEVHRSNNALQLYTALQRSEFWDPVHEQWVNTTENPHRSTAG